MLLVMKHFFLSVLLLAASCTQAQLPEYKIVMSGVPSADHGSITRYLVTSSALRCGYMVDVWTPDGYAENTSLTYPVIYAQDGQNLFDPELSYAGVAWELDTKAQSLATRGEAAAPIIVGISNRGAQNLRPNDYFPEKALTYIAQKDSTQTAVYETCKAGFFGDEYAAFITKELKPLIDCLYRTNPAPSHTFAMGSSMGGLISLYLLCEYPDVFGGAACLSTHWIGSLSINTDYSMNDDPVCAHAILAYADANIPPSETHKLYLDQGTTGWDAGYLAYEQAARQIVKAHGYSEAEGTLMTYDAVGAGHNEWYWQQRAEKPLGFLLNKDALSARAEPVLCPSEAEHVFVSLLGVRYCTDDATRLIPGIYIHNHRKVVVR